MDKLTDFTDTTDVSDAAIEWAAGAAGYNHSPRESREYAGRGDCEDRAIIIAARLIQQHRPELLVDPLDAIVREELAKACESAGYEATAVGYRQGRYDQFASFVGAKRLYQMGLEAGKGQGNA